MKSLATVVLLLLLSINPGQPLSYPIYGQKRYHRTAASSAAASPNIMPSASQSYPSYNYNSYYDNQPILSSSSSSSSTGSSSTGSNQLSSYGSLPFSLTNYPTDNNNNMGYNLNDNNNNYYYYPHLHEYHSYGLPTYHGDYKPKPYYYAPAPRYSYFEDHEITSNPFDDLHEEMLHEDERIQHRQVLQDQPPAYFGKENWYQTGGTRQDELTNNFLRNLIAYNRQLEQQERERLQLNEENNNDDYMQRDQYAVYNNEPEPEYDDYSEMNDYEYEQPQPIEPQNVLERKKFEKIQANQQQQILQEQQQRQQYQNKLNDVTDDEDVRQLKNLAKYSKQKQREQNSQYMVPKQQEEETYKIVKPKLSSLTSSQYNYDIPALQKDQKSLKPENLANSILKSKSSQYDYNKPQTTKYIEPVEQEQTNEESDEWYTPQQSNSNSNSEKSSYSSVPQYDEPEEYYEDDGAWISWDRKRSNDRSNFDFDPKYEITPKRTVDLIKAFNDRKPQKIKYDNSKLLTTMTTLVSPTSKNTGLKIKTTLSPSNFNKKVTTSSSTKTSTTTTIIPIKNNKFMGQKEVVLPRPASISQHIFSKPILSLINSESKPVLKEQQQKQQKQQQNSSPSADSSNKSSQKQSNKSSDAIYQTIKQLISMENHLDQDTKKHKRFVTNEESLVNELDKLKRQTKSKS